MRETIAVMTILLAASACLAGGGGTPEPPDPADLVLERYRAILLDGAGPDAKRVGDYAGSLGDDGTWADVDYRDGQPAAWRTVEHLRRVEAMAQAWARPGHPLHGDPAIRATIDKALDRWLAKRYRNGNWWWNLIGVPRQMRDVAVLLGESLTGDRRKGVLEVIGQVGKPAMTGANLMWTAELSLHLGCLAGDAARIERAARAILGEVVVGRREGIQTDWSFFQHGSRLQSWHYGRSYLDTVTKLGWQLRGTPWEFPEAKRRIVTQCILDGCDWMHRGGCTVPGTMDRAASRPNAMGVPGRPPGPSAMLRLWAEVDAQRRDELLAAQARRTGTGRPLSGFRHFPVADFTCYHRPGFSFFVKTISSRTLPTECGNGENLLGVPYLSSGDHYLLVRGDEYSNLAAVWNWPSLPGVTLPAAGPAAAVERQPVVGGLGDGADGLCAMDYRRGGAKGTPALAARKLWAFHGDRVVCLIGGWAPAGLDGEAVTSLEQCRLRGPVLVAAGDDKPAPAPPNGSSLAGDKRELRDGIERVRWVLHAQVGYLPLSPAKVYVRAGEQVGSWRRINRGRSGEAVREQVFLAVMSHGSPPSAGGFAVAPGVDAAGLDRLAKAPPWAVVRNDRAVQCIRFADGPSMAAFYEPGELADGAVAPLAVDRPCLALWTADALRLCDPTHKGGPATVTWQGRQRAVKLPPGGRPLHVE